jgi:hypothetical protein
MDYGQHYLVLLGPKHIRHLPLITNLLANGSLEYVVADDDVNSPNVLYIPEVTREQHLYGK